MPRRLNYRIKIYKDASGQFRWRMQAHNNHIIADSAEAPTFANTVEALEKTAEGKITRKTYRDVGVHFRGNSSYRMVPQGSKRSLNLSFDLVHEGQSLGGYRTLNLLNANGDPTRFAGTGLPVVADVVPDYAGPLAGVLTGLDGQVKSVTFSPDGRRIAFCTDRDGLWNIWTMDLEGKNPVQLSRERLSTAQRMARVGSWSWDVTGDRWQWSEELYRIAGLSSAGSPPPATRSCRPGAAPWLGTQVT